MPKDYARRANDQTRQTKKRSTLIKKEKKFPWKALFILIVILALFIGIIIHVHVFENSANPKISAVSKQKINTQTPGAVIENANTPIVNQNQLTEKNSKMPQPIKFDFYSKLPEMSVSVANSNGQTTTNHVTYLLQIASLQQLSDAQAFQEKLSNWDFHTQITEITRGSVNWYRVQMGPFNDYPSVAAQQNALLDHHVSSIILALKRSAT